MQPITEAEMRELEEAYNKCAIELFKKMRTCGPNCQEEHEVTK
jgi:hypothetical protein